MQRLFGSKKHPKGPDFRRARVLEFDLSGTKFRVKAPPHTEPKYPPTIWPASSNIYDIASYSTDSQKVGEPAALRAAHIEYWPFYGLPFIHGCLGWMSFSFNILKCTTKLNLFNPNQFEQFVQLLIDADHKPPEGGWPESKKQFNDYRAPIDWTVSKVNGAVWISYQAHARHLRERKTRWLTPITDQHCIFISFKRSYYTPDFCCENAFQNLMQQITSTFEVELSPHSLKDKAEAKQRWPNAKYSEHIPEREWSIAS